MSRVITATEPVVQVVQPGKSIIDQILELPLESIVLAEVTHANGYSHARSILHRTGMSGWLITRAPSGTHLAGKANGAYLHEAEVRRWAESFEAHPSATFTVLHEGRGTSIAAGEIRKGAL